jgi:phage-related protein
MLPSNGVYRRVLRGREWSCSCARVSRRSEQSDRDDHAAVVSGLAKLRNRQYHREPFSKELGEGLFELRHVGELNTRIIWFFMKGRRIIAVHGIRNKGRAIPARDLHIARERMRDWQERA